MSKFPDELVAHLMNIGEMLFGMMATCTSGK